jgi:hypothetical protein
MTPPRRQNEDLKHVMAAWDCLVPGGTVVRMSQRQSRLVGGRFLAADDRAAVPSELPSADAIRTPPDALGVGAKNSPDDGLATHVGPENHRPITCDRRDPEVGDSSTARNVCPSRGYFDEAPAGVTHVQ